jgi:hypothetical protein
LTTTRSLIEGELTQTASVLQTNINQKLFTSSFNSFTSSYNAYTESNDTTINTLSSSISTTFGIVNGKIDGLSSLTGSYATTGSNTFNGNQTINGTLLVSSSMVYSGSVRGQVFPITIASNTASIDLSLGNFFTLQLISGSTTFLGVNNIQPGETITLRVTQPSVGFGNLNIASNVKFPQNFDYTPTQAINSIDVVTFVSFDSSSLLAVSSNNLI